MFKLQETEAPIEGEENVPETPEDTTEGEPELKEEDIDTTESV